MAHAVLIAALATAAALLTARAAETGKEWTYYGEAGPAQWPTLGFPQCAGERQSPINVVTSSVVETSLPHIEFSNFDQAPRHLTLANNYHSATAQMKWEKMPTIEGGKLPGRFEVINFHFHWGEDDFKGSEHTVDGESYPLEMHIVCKNTKYANASDAVQQQDGLAVLGVMFETSGWDGRILKDLEPALRRISPGGSDAPVPHPPRLLQLLPVNTREFYRYRGSLTTPGCHQAVTWTVFTEPLRVTGAQLGLFRALRGGPAPIGANYRPPQRRHGRTVLLSREPRHTQQQLPSQQQPSQQRPTAEGSRSGAGALLPTALVLACLQLLVWVGVGRWIVW